MSRCGQAGKPAPYGEMPVTTSKQRMLLPMGAAIDTDKGPLQIIKRLDSGLTGEVYEGELETDDSKIHVVIKIAKSTEYSQTIHNEGSVLKEMKGEIAPIYHSRGKHNDLTFLVMEFIKGDRIPDLLAKNGHLPEPQALTAALHLYQALHALHGLCKKTFVDLKFEDLWWTESLDNGRLKLTDFGTLEDVNERGVKRDALIAAVYFCAMLTGHTLNYSLGELKERAEPILRKVAMSDGARRLLNRLLHRNPSARLANIAEAANELSKLVNFWRQDVAETLEGGTLLLADAESASDQKSQQAHDAAVSARAAFDIVRLRLSPSDDRLAPLNEDIQRADKIISGSGYLERGKAYFANGDYEGARRNLEEGKRRADDPRPFRLWLYFVRTAEDVLSTVFNGYRDDAIRAVEILSDGDFQHAAERITGLVPHLNSSGWNSLQADCQLFLALKRAEDARNKRDFATSATAFREAMNWLEKLPDVQFVRDEEIGDLRPALEEVENRDATEGEAKRCNAQARAAIEQGQWEVAIDKARESFLADRSNPERLTDLQSLAEAALQRLNFAAAAQIAQIGTLAPHPPQGLLNALALATRLRQAELALQVGEPQVFIEQLREAHQQFPAVLQPLRQLMDEAARKTESARFLTDLAVFADTLADDDRLKAAQWRQRAAAIDDENRAKQQKAVDDLLQQTDALLAYEGPDPAPAPEGIALAEFLQRLHGSQKRLEDASQLIADAESLAAPDHYRSDEIHARRERIASACQQAQTRSRLTQDERDRRWKSIQGRWEQFVLARKWMADPEADPGVLRATNAQWQPALVQLLGDCYAFLAEVDANDSAVSVIITEASIALRRMGKPGWVAVQKEAGEQLSRIEADFREAQAAFQRGDSPRAAAEADRLAHDYRGSPEWTELRDNIAQAERWHAWVRQNPNLPQGSQPIHATLKTIRRFKKLLPPAYWQADVERYVQAARDEAKTQAGQHRGQPERSEFLATLRLWLDAEWMGRGSDSRTTQWDAAAFLLMAYHAARAGLSELERVIQATVPPHEIDSTLATLTLDEWTTLVRGEMQKEDEQRQKQEAKERRPKELQQPSRQMWLVYIGVVAVLVCSVLGLAGFILYQSDPEGWTRRIFGGPTPTTTSAVAVAATTTLSPPTFISPTPVPPTPVPPTPVPPTPTPIPPSGFQIDPATLYPPLPLSGEAAWVINDQSATVNPPLSEVSVWISATSTDEGANSEVYFYTSVGGATISWAMDVPLKAGLYQLYVLSTKVNSGGYGTQSFTVLLDNAPVSAYRGDANLIFNTAADKQAADEWLPIGAYEVGQNQALSVQAEIPDLRRNAFFALDRLLIVKVAETQRSMLDALPSGRVMVSVLDDSRAVVYAGLSSGPVRIGDYQGQPQTDALAWKGSFRSLLWDAKLKEAAGNTVLVKWSPLGRLPAGEYELRVWVPASHSTVAVGFTLLADGEELKPDTPRELNQNEHRGEWASLGTWTLAEEAAVGVQMTINRQPDSEIGFDAVALVRVGP